MKRTTIRDLQKLCDQKTKISMVTCYDYTFAQLVEASNIDAILVGDSLGNVIQGEETTIPVELDDIIYHTRAVVRGTRKPHIVADLPFLSYQVSVQQAVESAGKLLKRGGAQSVKLEGGEPFIPHVKAIVNAGIPVCGHLGLTPQSVNALGGFAVQARSQSARDQLLEDALALQSAGAFMLVLEMVPQDLAQQVADQLTIPVIGIGAGPHTDGQVLVLHDMLGLNKDFKPKFLKHFADLGQQTIDALNHYDQEVKDSQYPAPEHTFS